MSWFFKVARGWAPYSKEQSELLEAGFQRFHAGQKEPVVLDQWRVDLEQMIQYRSEDPSRSRAVKREGPAAAAPAAAAAPGAASSSVAQESPPKRAKLLMQLVAAADDELFSNLSPEELKLVSARLEKLQAGCLGRINAALPGQPSGDKDLTWTRCEFSTGHGQALYSPVLFTYARLFARLGNRPVLFQIRNSEIINAEASYNAYKLSYCDGEAEGQLIWPPDPYHWSEDGEHDAEMKLMPLGQMEEFRSTCGVKDDRPANEWFKAVLRELISVMQQQVVEKKAAALQQAFEELEECLADYFNYLPDKVMTVGEYVAQHGAAKTAG